MKLGLLIYGSLETLSGGYLYDRLLVASLRAQGDTVEIISLPWRNYAAHLADNLHFRLPPGLDLLIQDELNHPSLIVANRQPHPYPVVSLVHHLRASEPRPAWQNKFFRLIEKRYLDSVDAFIFNSKTTQGVVNEMVRDSRPALVAYPPTDRFRVNLSPDQVRSRATDSGRLRILFLGNLIPRKALHTLIDAVKLHPSAFTLDVVGSLESDPAYAHAVQSKVATAGLGSFIKFHGPLDNESLVEKLASAQVLAVPSAYEGFGIVYLEGMAFGLPSIGTTGGAAAEIIDDGATGYLVPPDNSKVLSERMFTLARDREQLARMSFHALERFRQQPSWEETAAEIRGFLLMMTA